jgi:hypothetical protein
MHRSIYMLAALAVFALPATSFADGTQTQAAQPVAAQPDPSQKVVCKAMSHEGMLVKTNVCHTQAEWDQMRTAQQHSVSDFQNRNYTMSSGH